MEGWYEESTFTTKNTGWSAGTKGANVELYAKWTPKKAKIGTVTVTFPDSSNATIAFTYDSSTVTYSSGSWTVPVSATVTLPDASATVSTYAWYVGGAVSNSNTTASASFTLTSAGYYQIVVVVTDSNGNIYSSEMDIQITE